jgi:hypothetical protein
MKKIQTLLSTWYIQEKMEAFGKDYANDSIDFEANLETEILCTAPVLSRHSMPKQIRVL